MAVKRAVPDAEVVRLQDDASVKSEALRGTLLLVNRAMEPGYGESNGVEYIRVIRSEHPNARLMLISNFAEAQAQAIGHGAAAGFGKDQLLAAESAQKLRSAIG